MATLEKIPNGQSASVSSTKNENDTGNSQEKYDFLQNSLVAEGESNEVHLNNLEKHFDLFSTLGDSYSATSTPITIGTYLSLVVGVGGSPVFFFGYILCMIFNMCVCLCMAEMSSIFPHSSGQIFWAAELSPKRMSRGLSYIVGWWTSAGWFMWNAATMLITAELIFALVAICNETFIIQPWKYYLVYVATTAFGLIINWPLFKWYPLMLKGLVVYINVGSLFLLITLLVRSHPKQNAEYVFIDIVNLTGWKSNGVVFFLGLLPGLTAVCAFDSAAHIAEEMPNPRRQVPQVMVGSALLSAFFGLVMLLVIMFCVVNPANLLSPVGGEPIAQLLLDSLDSLSLTIISMIVFIGCFIFSAGSLMTTFSRVWWSFAREGGVPFSGTMSKIDNKYHVPVNALIFTFFAVSIIGLLELGAATALNAILGAGTLFLFLSYGLTIACGLATKREGFAVAHYFNLGRTTGMILSIISVVWIAFITIWLCIPSYVPVTGTSMNYTAAVLVAVNVIAGINWVFYSRKTYTSPKEIFAHREEISSV